MARQTPNGWTAYRAAPVPPSVATAALLIGVVGAGLSLLGGVAAIGLGFLNVNPKFAHDQYVRFVFVGTAGSVLLTSLSASECSSEVAGGASPGSS